ncbi:hypothetical protein LAZ67_23000499 [Cordylochernes scorpioides]|uniref:Uncharacterized protein n=1 Tax=Cordylochernes scorpioides TaxID=51811 RepID=A0ABY6LR28_9ARAC|nr:hypothetical protein LAZ67_23000499 [Cordylochernes scorpioides]
MQPSPPLHKQVFIDRFQRREREINSPAGAVVKEGAEIAVGLKGLCAERTSQSGKERQFGDTEICGKEKTTPCAASPNKEYKRCSSCIPGSGDLTEYYQPDQLNPGFF